MKVFFRIIILFMLFYSFKVPILYNSVFAAFMLSLFFMTGNSLRLVFSICKQKSSWLYLLLFSTPFLYYISLTTFSNKYDYTLIPPFVGSLLYYIVTLFIVCIVFSKTSLDEFKLILILIILFQAMIIVLSFSLPAFQQMLDIFRTTESIEISQRYYGGGIRGLALSGSQFFGLSSLLAVMTFIAGVLEFESTKRSWVFLLLIVCSVIFMSVGRTAIIGIIIFQLYAVASFKQFLIYILKILATVPPIAYALFNLLKNVNAEISQKISNFGSFAFEMIYNYMDGNKLSTSSTDKLDHMYYAIDVKTILFGDGLYTNVDGTYYGYTDAGYMRHALAFGIPMSILLIMATYVLVKNSFINYKTKQVLFFMSLLALLHYKGEVFGTLIGMNIFMFFIYCFSKANDMEQRSSINSYVETHAYTSTRKDKIHMY